MSVQVLVVDDEALLRQSLRGALSEEGYVAGEAASGTEALERLAQDRPDVVVLDLVLGDLPGLDVLARIRADAPETKVIVISAHGSIDTAVAAMKAGAYDFIRKPFELEEVLSAVGNAARTAALEGKVRYLEGRERQRTDSGGMIFTSAAMQRVVDELAVIAKSPVPVVLILGESGTGKALAARMVHERSSRAAGPFVELNCSAIPETLVESELFGHERGAFSDARERKLGLVEVADGGTLFLDEIGDLGLGAQAKLLTFLEQRTFRRLGATVTRQVDTRVVAATHRDLAAMVGEKVFRQDLLYRLNAMTVRLPPLRERREDLLPLSEHFLRQASREFGKRWQTVAADCLTAFAAHSWPGNARELKAVISRAALFADGETLQLSHLPAELLSAAGLAPPEPPDPTHEATLEEVELGYIRAVLARCGGNRTLAATKLGITRQTLSRRIGGSPEEA